MFTKAKMGRTKAKGCRTACQLSLFLPCGTRKAKSLAFCRSFCNLKQDPKAQVRSTATNDYAYKHRAISESGSVHLNLLDTLETIKVFTTESGPGHCV